ncbi:MAG: hypothetical protein ACK47M_03030 [Caldilinea sp.]
MPRQELLKRFDLQAEDFAPFLRGLTALRTKQHKLVVSTAGDVELFDLQNDPAELANQAERMPDALADLQAMHAEWQASVGASSIAPTTVVAPPTVTPEVAERLKALGYLD